MPAPSVSDGTAHYDNVDIKDHGSAYFGGVNITNHTYSYPIERQREEAHLDPRVFFYRTMNYRMDQIYNAMDTTCQWIWTTELAAWLRNPLEHVFWISGKPGSGKSTLIKYLSTTTRLHSFLSPDTRPWEVLSFYFDFRRRDDRENSLEGLFRALLYGLMRKRRELLPRQFPGYHDGEDIRIINMIAAFKFALHTINLNIIIFVDGLDEYTGDVKILLQQYLLPLSQHENVKLCMASRRDANIRHWLQKVPNIHISDPQNNETGIRDFIKMTFETFDGADFESLQLDAMREKVQNKAEGVFLWVALASAEVVKACVSGATADEIKELIDELPKDIELMYDRILQQIPQNRKVEAAVIYKLISGAKFRISIDLLRATLYFISYELCSDSIPRLDLSIAGLERRLISSLGGLLEVGHKSTADNTESHDGTSEIRFMHETVRAFSERTCWAEQLLPLSYRNLFPSHAWARLCYEAILRATSILNGQICQFQFSDPVAALPYSDFYTCLASLDRPIAHQWTRLLYYSIKQVVVHAEEDTDQEDVDFNVKCRQAMNSPLSTMHTVLFEPHIAARRGECRLSIEDFVDLTLAALHCAYSYLSSRQSCFSTLTDVQRYEVALLVLNHLDQVHCLEPSSRGQSIRLQTEKIRNLIDLILTFNASVTGLSLNLFLVLGYPSVPRFLQTPFKQGVQCWIANQRALVTSHPSLLIEPSISDESPLFTWACENTVSPVASGLSMKFQLTVLRNYGVDVNEKSSAGYPIVNFIISIHVVEHVLVGGHRSCNPDANMTRTIEKLYALDEVNADFGISHLGQTPLEALKGGIDSFIATPLTDRLSLIDLERLRLRLGQLHHMLKHKNSQGHLPRPKSLENEEENWMEELLEDAECECWKCSHIDIRQSSPVLISDDTTELVSFTSCFE